MKQKVYIETSIVSYLTARTSNDLRAMANQNTTIEWWESRMPQFDIYISEFVVAETVRELGKLFISEGPIPAGAEIDAFHIAVSAVNGMDYLLTWNCKHIAN